jgi:hypothetical protein
VYFYGYFWYQEEDPLVEGFWPNLRQVDYMMYIHKHIHIHVHNISQPFTTHKITDTDTSNSLYPNN